MSLYDADGEVYNPVRPPIEEVMKDFHGYSNPFWYERYSPKIGPVAAAEIERDAQAALLKEKKRLNLPTSGTKPDIEIRWKK